MWVKKIALQKNISPIKLTETINRYQKNADKIFKLEDMDIEDIIKISYLW